jgi:hypothetical protein
VFASRFSIVRDGDKILNCELRSGTTLTKQTQFRAITKQHTLMAGQISPRDGSVSFLAGVAPYGDDTCGEIATFVYGNVA